MWGLGAFPASQTPTGPVGSGPVSPRWAERRQRMFVITPTVTIALAFAITVTVRVKRK
jgi:hypothetical protein